MGGFWVLKAADLDVLPEPLQAKAIQFLDEYRQRRHDLLAPDIFPVEALAGSPD